jgi:hypothetical protein
MSSVKDVMKARVLQEFKNPQWQKLPASKEAIKGTVEEVDPPDLDLMTTAIMDEITEMFWTPEVRKQYHNIKGLDPKGDVTLLVVPTDKPEKATVVEKPLENALQRYSKAYDMGLTLTQLRVKVNSGVGEQPYGILVGLKGACNRGKNLLSDSDSMSKINREIKDLEDNGKKVKNVIIGSIENFILPAKTKIGNKSYKDDIDFGACIYVDLAAKKVRYRLSHGTPLPKDFVNFAQSFGFENNDDGKNAYGLITVGDCMHYTLSVSSGDWHQWVLKSGRSRFAILEECNTQMLKHRPLPFMKPPKITRGRSSSASSGVGAHTAGQRTSRSRSRGQEVSSTVAGQEKGTARSSSTHSRRQSSTGKAKSKEGKPNGGAEKEKKHGKTSPYM